MDSKTILLVEDNPDDQFLTLRALRKSQVAAEAVVVSDAIEALAYLRGEGAHSNYREASPGLLLLDLKLPKMDGLELLQTIRSDHRSRLIPIVILTSSIEERDIRAAYSLGVNSYVRKPVEFNEFAELIRQVATYWLELNVIPGRGSA